MNEYSRNVFINCPFDKHYKALQDAMLFVVIVCGFNPRIALESSDSGCNRIDKIMQLISESKYSIHDLSRCVSTEAGESYRLNMPLELGIDYGCRRLNESEYSDKAFLILEKEKYSLKKALSDLSGVDVKAHNDEFINIIECVRNWFADTVRLIGLPSDRKIYYDYLDFQLYYLERAQELGYSEKNYIHKVTCVEYMDFVQDWKNANQTYCNGFVKKVLPIQKKQTG